MILAAPVIPTQEILNGDQTLTPRRFAFANAISYAIGAVCPSVLFYTFAARPRSVLKVPPHNVATFLETLAAGRAIRAGQDFWVHVRESWAVKLGEGVVAFAFH